MQPAAEKLATVLNQTTINDMLVPVVSNTDAKIIASKEAVIPTLLKQIVSPVQWIESVEAMIADGVDTFIELGPGKALLSCIKRISKDVKLYNIQDIESFEKTLSALK
jgi:[acyl-carrier-protein] S-malonyltransferase